MKEREIRDLNMVDTFFKKEKEWLRSFAGKNGLIREEFTTEVVCPCCSNDNSTLLFYKNYFKFVECSKCSTIYVNPRFTQDMIDKYYETREERLNYQKILTSGKNQTNRIKQIFKPRKKMIENYLGRNGIDISNSRLIDIGCASGQFLSVFKDGDVKELFGVEASADLASEAKKAVPEAIIIDKPFENADIEEDYFDIVTLWEVLEHIFDPYVFLKKITRIVRNGGILVLSVPNIEGFDIQILWDKGNAFSPPSHLNYFRKSSINILIERAGLTVEEIHTPGLLDVDIVRNRMNSDPEILMRLGSFWSSILSRSDKEADRFAANLQSFIRRSNMSSHMVVISRKLS